jgi:hypothetical protein
MGRRKTHLGAKGAESLLYAREVRAEIVAEHRAAGTHRRPPVAQVGYDVVEIVARVDVHEIRPRPPIALKNRAALIVVLGKGTTRSW